MKFLDTYRPQIFAAARIVFGFLFALHGAQKLFLLFGGPPAEMPDAARYLIGGIEFIGGAMIAIGFRTRLAAFICSGQMAVAYFLVHQIASEHVNMTEDARAGCNSLAGAMNPGGKLSAPPCP